MRGDYQLVTPPTSYPVTTEQTKTWLRESGTTYDDQIDGLIAAATEEAEKYTWRQLVSATYKVYFNNWPCDGIFEIWKTPVTSITHIKYQDSSDSQQTLDPSTYYTDLVSAPARIQVISPPPVYQYGLNRIEIQFVCGWANAALVPSIIKTAIMTRVATYYETPQEVVTGTQVHQLPMWFEKMLSNYKVDYV